MNPYTVLLCDDALFMRAMLRGIVFGCIMVRGVAARQTAQLLNDRRQALALDVLHRVEIDALFLSDGEDGHDVRVVQLGGCLRFISKAGDLPLV